MVALTTSVNFSHKRMAAIDSIAEVWHLGQFNAVATWSVLWSGVASVTQPRQLVPQIFLMDVPKSGLFHVVTSQNGCYAVCFLCSLYS